MIYVEVKNNKVTNRAEFDGEIPENWPEKEVWFRNEEAQIGWVYKNKKFEAPVLFIDNKNYIQERDKRLKESDWIVIRSLETGNAIPEQWLDYRQALRDLTKNSKDMNNIEWPIKPIS